MRFLRSVALLGCAASVLSKPIRPLILPRQDGAPLSAEQTICGDLIVATKQGYTLFYAEEVSRCLRTVPFNDAVATRFINYYNMTLQFQTTAAFLKDPPIGYQQPSVDVQQRLQQIQSNVTAGNYKNQYSFEVDLQLLVHSMHDSHVTLSAGILDAFTFLMPYGLVSVSVDGKQLPEIYLAEDLLESKRQGWPASPVSKINDQDVLEYLTEFAQLHSNGNLEPHADWNALMDNPALWIRGDLSVVQSSAIYPGDGLNYTFKNGSIEETYWLARYNELEDTGPLTTAGDFYNYFVLGLLPDSYDPDVQWWPSEETDDTLNDGTKHVNPYKAICDSGDPADNNWCFESYGAYPNDPDVAQANLSIIGGGVITGYLYDDISTGVLSIPSFWQYDENVAAFDIAIQDFRNNATQSNISRVVIDLTSNTGGNVYLAFNTFKQIFYDIDPIAASRIRSHKLADVLGTSYSKWWKELEKDFDGNEESNGAWYNYTAADEWVVLNRINLDTGRNFSSWAEYYGQVSAQGDLFSAVQRYNLSDEVFDTAAFNDWIPYGYGIAISEKPVTRPWAPESIVILTDGACGSSCALFVELMSHQAGVRTITVGGRPTTGPMQAVSGSRGARIYDSSELDNDFEFVSDTIKDSAAAAQLPNRTDTGMWVSTAGINIRDHVRGDDATPLQFKYEAADCRLYYTLDNVFNMTRLWRDAAAATWDNPSLCVSGSTGFPSARNTSSSLPPPARSAQPPKFDIELAKSVPSSNDTFGSPDALQAGPTKASGAITGCKSNKDCLGGAKCLPTSLKCGSGNPVSVNACLPECVNSKRCPNTSKCYLDAEAPSKFNAFKEKSATSPNDLFYTGHCRPTGPTLDLPCPKR